MRRLAPTSAARPEAGRARAPGMRRSSCHVRNLLTYSGVRIKLTAMVTDADRKLWNEACQRLTERFGDVARDSAWQSRRHLEPITAVGAVADAIEFEQPVDADDVRAGLRLLPRARISLMACELDLIRRGREVGLTWEEIGSLLGIGDRRAAQQRQTRLRERFEAALDDPVGDRGD
jgi:hypothetical protein